MDNWKKIASDEIIQKVITNLQKRNIDAEVIETSKEANQRVLELLPKGSHVLTSTSVTLEQIGVHDEIEEMDDIVSVRKEYMALDHQKDGDKIRELRSTPDIVIGSVHAVTEDGQILIASNTGSQIGAYAYSAKKVIWVVGAHKIVKNFDEGMKRINDYIIPLEEKHMQNLYGRGTNLSKLLVYNNEVIKGRVRIIFVKEVLGF